MADYSKAYINQGTKQTNCKCKSETFSTKQGVKQHQMHWHTMQCSFCAKCSSVNVELSKQNKYNMQSGRT